jgi:hypothetical protein
MKTPLTIGQFIAFLIFVIPSSLFWAFNAEKTHKQVEQNKIDILKREKQDIKKRESDEKNFMLVLSKLHDIELNLKDKKNRTE